MKRIIRYPAFIIIITITGLLFSCEKITQVTLYENSSSDTTTTIIGDTTIITAGNVVIKYSKTPPCYPDSEVFTFTATATGISSSATYNWSFGDGNLATGTTVQHGYDATAPYVVRLDIRDSVGDLLHTVSLAVQAWGQPIKPVADFYTQFDFSTNLNYVTFNSESSLNKGSIVNYLWNWADGTTTSSALGLVRHQFPFTATDVTYPVKLTITTDAGCTSDTVVNVTIPATYPITGDLNTVAYNSCSRTDSEYIVFTPTAINVPSGAVYVWNFSDGTGTYTGSSYTYTYKYMNDYDVIMMIYLNGRLIYTTHKMVHANGPNARPVAIIKDNTLVSSSATTIVESYNSGSTVAHGGISGYAWDFGNGLTDNAYDPFVVTSYTRGILALSYTVRLIVSANNCYDTAYSSVTIPAQ